MNAIALCSGGLDSTVSLAIAISRKIDINLILFFDYGQKAKNKELSAVKTISKFYGIKLLVIPLPFLRAITKTSLVNKTTPIPKLTKLDLKNAKTTSTSAKNVWVPNRNGLFLNIAACFCDGMRISHILTGFDKEEAKTFSDNSVKFIKQINKSLELSTLVQPQVLCFTSEMVKYQIVEKGIELGAPLNKIWSCYLGDSKPCMNCESCQRANSAFSRNGLRYG